ncbi:Alpha/Beta hydrolase protein [Corynascus similis CBS 632.67]
MPTAWGLANRLPAGGGGGGGEATFYLALGATLGISTYLLASTLLGSSSSPTLAPAGRTSTAIPSPLKTQIPALPSTSISSLPYPPDVLPGGRTVATPYGTIQVFEWGPLHGEKVLLLHGISTPCVALGALAEALVERGGYRVMVFDLFGRGYSDAPPDLPYDLRLYTTQILLALASSPLAWTGAASASGQEGDREGEGGFHLVGYSLGGGLAVPFARFFARMLRSVVVVAGGGLIREEHVGWRSRALYSTTTARWVPEGLVRWFVKRRLMPRTEEGGAAVAATETEMAKEVVGVATGPHKNSDASGGQSFDNAVLLARRPEHTVSSVMDWQLRHHEGFIPAFISSIRHAPIYDQKDDWRALGQLLAERRERLGWEDAAGEVPGLEGGKILIVLGASDPVIVKEELIHDATAVLGEDGFEAVVLDAGHELVMTKANEVAAVMINFWARTTR